MLTRCPHCGEDPDGPDWPYAGNEWWPELRGLDLAVDREAAITLAHRMSCLSEEHWCAGWDASTSEDLWKAIQPGAHRMNTKFPARIADSSSR